MNDALILVAWLVVIALAVAIWLVPVLIAERKHHPQTGAIKACTLCALVFPLAWIVALIWACVNAKDKDRA